MPIPLGILAVAGAGGAGGVPAYTLIQSFVLSSDQSSITFSSIPQTYKHLQIRYTAKNSGSSADFAMRINGITSSSYAAHWLFADGFNLTSGSNTGANRMLMPQGMTSSFTANSFGAGIVDIVDYSNASKLKTIRTTFGHNDSPRLYFRSFLETSSTSAVTSVTFVPDSNSIGTGSRFSLYGLS